MPEIPVVPASSSGDVKPGVFSSEFWLTLLTTIATIGGQIAGIIPPPWGVIVGAIASAAYTISRAFVKSAATTSTSVASVATTTKVEDATSIGG